MQPTSASSLQCLAVQPMPYALQRMMSELARVRKQWRGFIVKSFWPRLPRSCCRRYTPRDQRLKNPYIFTMSEGTKFFERNSLTGRVACAGCLVFVSGQLPVAQISFHEGEAPLTIHLQMLNCFNLAQTWQLHICIDLWRAQRGHHFQALQGFYHSCIAPLSIFRYGQLQQISPYMSLALPRMAPSLCVQIQQPFTLLIIPVLHASPYDRQSTCTGS